MNIVIYDADYKMATWKAKISSFVKYWPLGFELDANRVDGARVPMCPSGNIRMRQSSNVPIMCQSARRDRSTCQRLWDNCGGGRFLEARASVLVSVCLYCEYTYCLILTIDLLLVTFGTLCVWIVKLVQILSMYCHRIEKCSGNKFFWALSIECNLLRVKMGQIRPVSIDLVLILLSVLYTVYEISFNFSSDF